MKHIYVLRVSTAARQVIVHYSHWNVMKRATLASIRMTSGKNNDSWSEEYRRIQLSEIARSLRSSSRDGTTHSVYHDGITMINVHRYRVHDAFHPEQFGDVNLD